MPVSKPVAIGLGVTGAVVVIAVLVTVLVVYVKPGTPTRPPKSCGPAPAVNSATGEVSNYNHFVLPPGNTCGEDVNALNQLCLNTWVQDQDASYQRYEPMTHMCVANVPNPSCEQQLCDAMYCTSATVRHTLPPQHKHRVHTGECVNPSETDIASACTQLGNYQWVSPQCLPIQVLSVIRVFPETSTVSVLTGTLVMPQYDNMLFTYRLDGAKGDAQQGSVVITAAPGDKHCEEGSMCVGYNIYAAVSANNTYALTVFARPAWSPTVTLQSTEPVVVTITATPPDPHVTPTLNVHPSRDAVIAQLKGAEHSDTLKTVLAPLQTKLPGFQLPATLSFDDLLVSTNASAQLLTVACTPNLCPLEGSQSLLMPYAIVLVAWPPVPGAVSYTATRQRSENVGPVVEVSTGSSTVFADLVRVNDVVTYTIVTTGAQDMQSEPVSVTASISPFSDKEVCHAVLVPPPFNTKLPPWMWSSPSGCQWFPDLINAQNYYCMFEHENPDHVLQPDALKLVDRNGVCQPVLPAHAIVTHDFATPYCSSAQPGACFTGYKDTPRTAACPTELRLGDTDAAVSNVAAFSARLGEVVAFHNQYNTWDTANVDAISHAADREALYNKSYYSCGPETNASDWGVRNCGGTDHACVAAATSARCAGVKGDTSDRNYCYDWQLNGTVDGVKQYTQERLCFVSPDAKSDECCGENLTYVFDNQQPPGGTRGSCV